MKQAKMKILVIEDDLQICKMLKKGLEADGYAVDCVNDGEVGQRRLGLHHTDYNLVILDLMIPKRDGLEVCKEARKSGLSLPIIILTARTGLDDKVALLNAGADDYVAKPFCFAELLARVQALLRRPKESNPSVLYSGCLTINVAERKVFFKGEEVNLTLKEFSLLTFLVSRGSSVVDRRTIVSNVWGFDKDLFNNIVDVYINRLRTKFRVKGGRFIIQTIRGVGYKIKT